MHKRTIDFMVVRRPHSFIFTRLVMIDDGRHGEQQTNTTTRDWGVMMGEWDWGVVEPKSVFSDGMTDLPLVVDIQARDPSTILLQAPHLCTTQAEPISSSVYLASVSPFLSACSRWRLL